MKIDVAFEDVQPGDLVTLSYEGHEFSGEVWRDNDGMLMVGTTVLGVYDGSLRPWVFVSASREVKLPTGIGAVIRDAGNYIWVKVSKHYWYQNSVVIPTGRYLNDKEMLEGLRTRGSFKVFSEGVEID